MLPWSMDLLRAMNLAPSSDEDIFLASAKARRVPRGVAVISGMRKVSTEPICLPLTHSSCSMVTSGCTRPKSFSALDQESARDNSSRKIVANTRTLQPPQKPRIHGPQRLPRSAVPGRSPVISPRNCRDSSS